MGESMMPWREYAEMRDRALDAEKALAAKAEVERANELCIRDLEHTEKRAEQAEAEVALRDRMLRDIIERIALTPERWNGWTTEEVLTDLRARAEKEAADA